MKVSIVIPNYNGQEILKKNIPKVIDALIYYKKHSNNVVELVVNDDFSHDDSMNVLNDLKDKFKDTFVDIFILQNEKNYGFSTTVNRGVRASSGDFVVLLNTDVNPSIDFLTPLVKNFADPLVFGVGCVDHSIEGEKTVLRGRGIGYWKKGFLHHAKGDNTSSDTLWVSGGSSMFRKETWEKLGGLDEIYNPFYWEDIDLSYRAQKAGYKVLFESQSVVIHEHEKGAIKTKYKSSQVNKVAMRNQFIFIWKNITDISLLGAHFLYLPYFILKSLIKNDKVFLSGFIKALILLPKIIELRNTEKKLNKVSDSEILNRFK